MGAAVVELGAVIALEAPIFAPQSPPSVCAVKGVSVVEGVSVDPDVEVPAPPQLARIRKSKIARTVINVGSQRRRLKKAMANVSPRITIANGRPRTAVGGKISGCLFWDCAACTVATNPMFKAAAKRSRGAEKEPGLRGLSAFACIEDRFCLRRR